MRIIPVAPELFAQALSSAQDSPRGKFLSPYSAEELRSRDALCFVTEDFLSGGAMLTAEDGVREACALFNIGAPKGSGQRILSVLTAFGARRLDCIGDALRDLYTAQGWLTEEAIPWDDAYAPTGWDYLSNGRPNVYVLTYYNQSGELDR